MIIKQITENSTVSLGMVGSIVTALVLVGLWCGRLEGKVTAQEKQIDVLRNIDTRLSRIEGKLGISQ